MSCVCNGCCKWTVCEHTSLITSVFKSSTLVPDKVVAATSVLQKKFRLSSMIRGTTGARQARSLKEIAKQKESTISKLGYVDESVSLDKPA